MTWRLNPNGEIGEGVSCDDRIRILLETDVCKITGGWEYEAYCLRREKGLPRESLSAPGAPASGY